MWLLSQMWLYQLDNDPGFYPALQDLAPFKCTPRLRPPGAGPEAVNGRSAQKQEHLDRRGCGIAGPTIRSMGKRSAAGGISPRRVNRRAVCCLTGQLWMVVRTMMLSMIRCARPS